MLLVEKEEIERYDFGMKAQFVKLAIVSMAFTACDAAADLPESGAKGASEAPKAEAGKNEARIGVVADVEVEVKAIEGVDAFLRTEFVQDGKQSGLTAYPIIRDGCLFLEGEDGVKVIVWPNGSEALVEKLILQAKKGDKTPISLGGDDITPEEFGSKTNDYPSKCEIDSAFIVTPD